MHRRQLLQGRNRSTKQYKTHLTEPPTVTTACHLQINCINSFEGWMYESHTNHHSTFHHLSYVSGYHDSTKNYFCHRKKAFKNGQTVAQMQVFLCILTETLDLVKLYMTETVWYYFTGE